jgi:hypothetical protein
VSLFQRAAISHFTLYTCISDSLVFVTGRFSEAVSDLQQAVTLTPDLEPARQCLQQSLKDLELKEHAAGHDEHTTGIKA